MNIVINRKNIMKLQNSMYQNDPIKNKISEINTREASNDRKKYNLSPSEFQSE